MRPSRHFSTRVWLVADLLPQPHTGSVDDLMLGYVLKHSDGTRGRNTLGQASRMYKRPDTDSTISGLMEFDEGNFRDGLGIMLLTMEQQTLILTSLKQILSYL